MVCIPPLGVCWQTDQLCLDQRHLKIRPTARFFFLRCSAWRLDAWCFERALCAGPAVAATLTCQICTVSVQGISRSIDQRRISQRPRGNAGLGVDRGWSALAPSFVQACACASASLFAILVLRLSHTFAGFFKLSSGFCFLLFHVFVDVSDDAPSRKETSHVLVRLLLRRDVKTV